MENGQGDKASVSDEDCVAHRPKLPQISVSADNRIQDKTRRTRRRHQYYRPFERDQKKKKFEKL